MLASLALCFLVGSAGGLWSLAVKSQTMKFNVWHRKTITSIHMQIIMTTKPIVGQHRVELPNHVAITTITTFILVLLAGISEWVKGSLLVIYKYEKMLFLLKKIWHVLVQTCTTHPGT